MTDRADVPVPAPTDPLGADQRVPSPEYRARVRREVAAEMAALTAMREATRGHYRVGGVDREWACKCGDDRRIEEFEDHLNELRLVALVESGQLTETSRSSWSTLAAALHHSSVPEARHKAEVIAHELVGWLGLGREGTT